MQCKNTASDLLIIKDLKATLCIVYKTDSNYPKNFENVFDPLEKLYVPLNFGISIAKNLFCVNGDKHFRQAFNRIVPQSQTAMNQRWNSKTLYHAVQEVKADRANLTDYQERLVDMYLYKGRVNGLELSGEDRKAHIQYLTDHMRAKNHFRMRVILSHNLFSHTIENFDQVLEYPKSLVSQMAPDYKNPSRGPWRINLNKNIYEPFMEYCSHRMMRWNVWQAHRRRASTEHASHYLANHTLIETIRRHRKDMAEVLGYENFAEIIMETNMAGSVEDVINFIDSLKGKFYPKLVEDLKQLQEFANSEGFSAQLELWDIPYWRRRHKEYLYNIVETEDLMPYFPYNKVLDGLFNWCKLLFGVDFKDVTSTVQTWHEDVSCYSVTDTASGDEKGLIYIDPYRRMPLKDLGVSTECGRGKSDLLGTKPISYMTLNLTPPISKNKPTLLSVSEANSVFCQMGHALQQQLTEIPYFEVGGQNNVELDTLNTCAMVMSKLFYKPAVLRSISSHHETGEHLSDSAIKSVINMSKYLASFDIMYELYLSAYDVEMCISKNSWHNSMKKLWPEFMPVTLHKEDEHPCSMTDIFAGQYAASYYSFLWSEMLAADIIGMFEQVGFDNPDNLIPIGRRFRDTYFALGGGVPGGEVFRRFQGRDPSIESFIQYYNKID
ncbi:hypothetical protein LSH36_34g07036 [Paralvinella palmiformis]|uniref:Oligopeptidase A n=1 Tax=Paralvinella palmiformis TaxID=53620 RepID=A0AAD9K9D6_9ANNE|nr:hypothetical protein LSH36_34g07036 [Paralvinella palmiformis]